MIKSAERVLIDHLNKARARYLIFERDTSVPFYQDPSGVNNGKDKIVLRGGIDSLINFYLGAFESPPTAPFQEGTIATGDKVLKFSPPDPANLDTLEINSRFLVKSSNWESGGGRQLLHVGGMGLNWGGLSWTGGWIGVYVNSGTIGQISGLQNNIWYKVDFGAKWKRLESWYYHIADIRLKIESWTGSDWILFGVAQWTDVNIGIYPWGSDFIYFFVNSYLFLDLLIVAQGQGVSGI